MKCLTVSILIQLNLFTWKSEKIFVALCSCKENKSPQIRSYAGSLLEERLYVNFVMLKYCVSFKSYIRFSNFVIPRAVLEMSK